MNSTDFAVKSLTFAFHFSDIIVRFACIIYNLRTAWKCRPDCNTDEGYISLCIAGCLGSFNLNYGLKVKYVRDRRVCWFKACCFTDY